MLIKTYWMNIQEERRRSGSIAKPKPAAKRRKESVEDTDDDINEVAPTKKRGRPSKAASTLDASDEEEEDQPNKQKKPRKSAVAAKNVKRTNEPDAMAVTYTDMGKYKNAKGWENVVASIDTVEVQKGDLYIYFTL